MLNRTILLAGATLALSSCNTLLGQPAPPPGPLGPASMCVSVWPPVPAPPLPTGGSGINPPALRTVSGFRGTQVSYSGWPLYHFSHGIDIGLEFLVDDQVRHRLSSGRAKGAHCREAEAPALP